MQITVFGANGKVGSLVVAKLLAHGHSVTACVHGSSGFEAHPCLTIYEGDIYQESAVNKALAGSSAVLSTLGSWGTPKKDILTTGMRHIIPAMGQHGITRIVSLTGSDSRANGDTIGLIHRLSRSLLSMLAHKVLADGEQHIALLERSKLDWTVLRSPAMIETGNPAHYSLSERRPLPWQTIHRHSVASALVELVESDNYRQAAPYIKRSRS